MKTIDGFRAKKKAKEPSPMKAFATVLALAEFGGKSVQAENLAFPLDADEKAALEVVRRYVPALRRQVSALVKSLQEVHEHRRDSMRTAMPASALLKKAGKIR